MITKIVDELKSLNTDVFKLSGKIDDKDIIVNIDSGFLKPKIQTFINGEKHNDL